MADNTVTVSAIDRSTVKINGREGVGRDLALLAMSIGDDYQHTTNNNDLAFFRSVEFSKNGGIPFVGAFAVFAVSCVMLTYQQVWLFFMLSRLDSYFVYTAFHFLSPNKTLNSLVYSYSCSGIPVQEVRPWFSLQLVSSPSLP